MRPLTLPRCAFVALLLALGLAAPALAQMPQGCSSKEISQGFEEFGRTGKMPPDLGRWLADPKAQHIEPYQAFDNVWYVGVCWVSAWIVKTSEGAILIDTLHDPFAGQLIDNIRKVGVDPKDIKYVFMTHGHFDHAGGAYKLKPLTGAQFVMTQRGWDEALQSARVSENAPRPWTMIAADRVAKDGDVFRLGDQEVQVLETPGHTWGTASYLFKVKDGEKTYRAITVGGLGLNAIGSSSQVQAYINSVDRLTALMASPATEVQVHLTTHPFSNGLTEAARKIPARKPGEPHPLVDPQGFAQQLKALRAGAVERLAIEKSRGR
jgi:metallo-beta-lactamase class B